MTEQEWLAATDPVPLFRLVADKCFERAHRRRLHLFSCGSVRRIWHLLEDERSRAAVIVMEEFADKRGSWLDVEAARAKAQEACNAVTSLRAQAAAEAALANAQTRSWDVCREVSEKVSLAESEDLKGDCPTSKNAQCDILRDIIGNPFRPIAIAPDWPTSTVLALAQGIYEEHAFDRMPILADALQDAGCDNAAVLDHCRGPGPHVRGCWVVDMLLGKS